MDVTGVTGGAGVASDRVATLETVAAEAGVSRATVSRVINGSPRVSPEARSAVQAAIGKLGYVPNQAARSLVTRRTDSVALVISEPDTRVFADPYLSSMVRAISQSLSEADKQLMLLMAQNAQQRARLERYVAGGHVDGVLLISLHQNDPLPHIMRHLGVPTVAGGRPGRAVQSDVVYVDVDNTGGARVAVERLVSSGRTRVATIAGPQDMTAGQDRLEGYRSVIREAGLREQVAYGDFSEASGAVAMCELLAGDKQLDAVFVASDLMATAALRILRAAGRHVPSDVAVVGFDDLPGAPYTDPPLTTIHQPIQEAALKMTELLLASVDGDTHTTPVILPTELVVRSSG